MSKSHHSDASNKPAGAIPQPIRGLEGADDPGPRNLELDHQNPSLLLPPSTDHGSLPNLKFSFSQAHNRIEDGGWAREVTRRELPVATAMAGVNMRLGPGVVRELHWHKESEWGYVTRGTARVTAIDTEGRVFIDEVKAGGIWLFPPGIPHSIQGVDPEVGTEFILVFNDGDFSEYQTLLITEWFAHTPRDILAKNFGVSEDVFKNIPKSEKYIFRQPLPPALEEVRKQLPQNPVPCPYTFHSDQHEWTKNPGGDSLIIDDRNFPVTTMAALLMDIKPGALRELHWHPDADEWMYVMEGQGRFTVFDATSTARTFDLRPGDVAYIPKTLGHYIESNGKDTLRVFNVFSKPRFEDVSLNQWMAATPAEMIKGHLNVGDDLIKVLRSTRCTLVK